MTNENLPLTPGVAIRPDEAVSRTVYSAVWPETEALVRHCMTHETNAMLARHRQAHTKRQDSLHEAFFDAWRGYVAPTVDVDPIQFPHHYPCNGSSEAIREIIRTATWGSAPQDLVMFDGEYEGYEMMASMQGTVIHRIVRANWRQTLAQWKSEGTPWEKAGRRAQWWISHPSAIDGNIWLDFDEWLHVTSSMKTHLDVWVDLCYVGVTTRPFTFSLDFPQVAGLVFSLSKTMGAYYRRIGGCFSRAALPGLWGNGWFKNLDSLYLGTRWLNEPTFQGLAWHATLAGRQEKAMRQALRPHRAEFLNARIVWEPADVALLMSAEEPRETPASLTGAAARWWLGAGRGDTLAARRLCLTPSFDLGEH
jgi:hypothetical protein